VRAATHLRIGRLLAARISPETQEKAIFEIVNQLNRGAPLIAARDEREQLADFNLIAGKRAKGSTAYASALTYIVTCAALLAEDSWERRRELTFALELHRAECEFLTGARAEAEQRLAALSSRAATTVERATVACLMADLYMTLDQSNRAVAVGLDYLRHLGIDWLPHPTEEEARHEYQRIWSQLGGRTIEELVDLPLMTDPASLATLDVLTKLGPAAFFTDFNLFSLAVCRAISLSLEHGYADGSCPHFEWLGSVAGARFGDYQAGARFGQLGYDLVEKRGLKRFQARTYNNFAAGVLPWTKHVRAIRDLLRRAFEAGNKIGDLFFAAFSCGNLNSNLLAAGDPLVEVQLEIERSLVFADKIGFGYASDVYNPQLGLVRTLRGLTPKFGSFDDHEVDELRLERRLSGNADLAPAESGYWIRKMQARFMAGDYAAAVEASSRALKLQGAWQTTLEMADHFFYGALSRAAFYDSAPLEERQQHLEALAGYHRQLEVWAANCPENFENRAALVSAEIARIEGRILDAEQLYEQAIRSADANGFVHNEGVANELASRFYAARGFENIAHIYLQDARYCYLSWGADGKVRQLDRLYRRLREEEAVSGPASTIGAPVENLDLATVVRVSQAVSGEIVLEKLIDTLMVTALQHAGAGRGLLIVLRGDRMQIEAEAVTDRDKIAVRLLGKVPAGSELPDSVFQYVLRTKEGVILDDASADTQFSADPYFIRTRARSILCLPLVKQATLTGVLYLENSLASHVFTPARIEVLKLLASQAAISLENAHLFTDLDQAYTDLHQAQAYLSEAQRLSQTGSVSWAPSSGELIWSSETYRIFDYDPTIKPTVEMVLQRVHPEDRSLVQQLMDRASRTGHDWNLDHRLLMPDGSVKHLHVVAHAVKNDSRGEVSFVGAVMDVTAAKQSQQALEQAFREIKTLKDQLQSENIVLREEIDKASMFEQIVGTSAPLRNVLSRVSKVAPTDSSVLITGETGTGKELVARAIHRRSRRSSRAFVSVNCAAIPRDLIASELFGHEKGAFTGATQRRLGRFELAEGGTIFLDEVGELPAETQIALLRVLQEREFERVGAAGSIRTNVRVIAATNRDLEAAIAAGTFRSDLFYRLNVFPIEMPSLRERREDIPLLVEYFIDRFARQSGKSFQALSKKSLDLLQSYPWPGNIRELQNVIERSVIVCETQNFSVDESWLSRQPPATEPNTGPALYKKDPSQEKATIEAALSECEGRVYGPSGAAAKLGIPRSTLESKIRSFKINKKRFKTAASP